MMSVEDKRWRSERWVLVEDEGVVDFDNNGSRLDVEQQQPVSFVSGYLYLECLTGSCGSGKKSSLGFDIITLILYHCTYKERCIVTRDR
jgi:hypothetical protein